MNKINTKKGFTIIEVVLVLAIAGLIFLMVFLALPALQRNQRDTQRKNDLSRAQSAISNYQTNNRGRVPANLDAAFISAYLTAGGDTFTDPSGTNYTSTTHASGQATGTAQNAAGTNPTFTAGALHYWINARCDGENVVSGGGNTKVAIGMKLEGGGTYCLNN